VGFVEDEQVPGGEAAAVPFLLQGVAELVQHGVPLQEIHRGDEAGEAAPGVDVRAVLPAQADDGVAVDEVELQVELGGHLLLPLPLERRRTDDHAGAHARAGRQLLEDEARLDRLAEPHVVGDEEVDAGHDHGARGRLELVGLQVDRSAEGGEKARAGQHRRGGPADRRQEGVEDLRPIPLPRGRGEGVGMVDLGIDLALPEDRQRLSEPVVVEALEFEVGDDAAAGVFVRDGILDQEEAVAHLDELAGFGQIE